ADLESFAESVSGEIAAEPTPMEVDTFFSGMTNDSLVEREEQSMPLVSSRAETPPSIGVIRTPSSNDTVPPISRETPPFSEPVEASSPSPFDAPESVDDVPFISLGTPVSMDAIEPEPMATGAHFESAEFDALDQFEPPVSAETPAHATPAYFETPIRV